MGLQKKIKFSEKGSGLNSIICLHGIGGDEKSFSPQLNGLSRSKRIISWNMPGYNGSKPLEKMTFKNLSNSLLEFMDELKIKKAVLLGQSIGGMIAQELYFNNPKRVQGLILIATTSAFGGKNDDFKNLFVKSRLEPLNNGKSMNELANLFIPEILGNYVSSKVKEKAIASMSNISEEIYRQVIKCLITFDRYRDFKNISVPCCLIAGEEDKNAPFLTMQKMASQLHKVEFHIIKKAGHLVNLEKPRIVNKILLNFLNSNY